MTLASETISARRFAAGLADLADLPITRYPALPLLGRVYRLRSNASAYDAAYIALAEELGCPLLTADQRLATAPGPRCPITTVNGHPRPIADDARPSGSFQPPLCAEAELNYLVRVEEVRGLNPSAPYANLIYTGSGP